jgi:hypothetical protein
MQSTPLSTTLAVAGSDWDEKGTRPKVLVRKCGSATNNPLSMLSVDEISTVESPSSEALDLIAVALWCCCRGGTVSDTFICRSELHSNDEMGRFGRSESRHWTVFLESCLRLDR